MQKQATPLRLQSYQDLLGTYEDDTDPSTKDESRRKAKLVRNTIAGESTRHIYRNIRQVLKPTAVSSLSTILTPQQVSQSDTAAASSAYRILQDSSPDDLLWDTVVERDKLEEQIPLYNKDSFRAAAESPCGHGVIHDALTFTSLSPEAKELLQGAVPSHWHGHDNVLRQFLASFVIPEHVKSRPEIPTAVLENDVLKGFKTWKETTSTSPSGRHLGHYKALICHPILLRCFSKFMNIAISQGIAIPRWCNLLCRCMRRVALVTSARR